MFPGAALDGTGAHVSSVRLEEDLHSVFQHFSRAVFSSMVLGRGPLEMALDLGALAVFFGGFLILTVITFRYERTP